MNAAQSLPIKDVRALYNEHGPDALKNVPVRPWSPAPDPVPTKAEGNRSMQCIRWDQLSSPPDTDDLVENLLTHGGFSLVFGKSSVGKSFFTLDLAAHIVWGADYRGELCVDGGAVIYVTLEGHRAFPTRLYALQRAGKLREKAPFYVIMSQINLLEATDPAELIQKVQQTATEAKIPVRLIIIDTLSRAMPGGDESSAVDMTKVIRAIDEIRTSTRAHVMLVHHCGKDEAKGARGHSSLRAAVDTEIEIAQSDDASVILARVSKQRDLAPISPMAFSLVSCVVGTNKKGKPITSCTVRHIKNSVARVKIKTAGGTRKPMPSLDEVLELAPPAGESISKTQFRHQVGEKIGSTVRDTQAAVEQLIANGKLIVKPVKSPAGQRQMHIERAPAG